MSSGLRLTPVSSRGLRNKRGSWVGGRLRVGSGWRRWFVSALKVRHGGVDTGKMLGEAVDGVLNFVTGRLVLDRRQLRERGLERQAAGVDDLHVAVDLGLGRGNSRNKGTGIRNHDLLHLLYRVGVVLDGGENRLDIPTQGEDVVHDPPLECGVAVKLVNVFLGRVYLPLANLMLVVLFGERRAPGGLFLFPRGAHKSTPPERGNIKGDAKPATRSALLGPRGHPTLFHTDREP